MTGVYILHYSVFHLLVMLIPVHSLATVGGNSADLCPVGAHFPCRALQYAAQEGDYLVTDNGTI